MEEKSYSQTVTVDSGAGNDFGFRNFALTKFKKFALECGWDGKISQILIKVVFFLEKK